MRLECVCASPWPQLSRFAGRRDKMVDMGWAGPELLAIVYQTGEVVM